MTVLPTDDVDAFVGVPEVLLAGGDGPLAGSTLAVKDVIDVAGRVTGAGNPDLAASRAPAPRSAPVVDALVAAGATVVGKTVTDELAYSLGGDNVHYAVPRNVAAPGRSPGGSSSGSAAAVAAGLVDVALGTDTGGSIRVPASYCGILGWRPTHGAVSAEGVTPLAPSFDTIGLLARSAPLLRDAAEVALGTGPLAGAAPAPVRRLALAAELVDVLEPEVAEALLEGIEATLGSVPARRSLGIDVDECLGTFRTLQGAEAWAEHGAWITSSKPTLGPATAYRFDVASRVTASDVAEARPVRERVRAAVLAATADGTVLLGPPAAGPAPEPARHDEASERIRADTLRLTSVAGLAGAPVVVLPGASVAPEGFPLGIALMGAPGTDLALLDLAAGR
ncbi:amidase [Dermatobacter hominis]|uniref:amidase n=1 Tax=Dermatobacter hominis TaxID=2884263 RepID=UPI001D11CCC1|nr:amidase [Dermatobacter hominis]UDY37384.1 amidase [Dermatobacter hominis]